MHKLSVNTGVTVWALLFKDKEGADAAEEKALGFMRMQHLTQQTADNRMLTLEDDYGQRANVTAGALLAILSEDLDLTQEAMIRLHLLNQHTQIKAQQRIANDPTIKAAQIGQRMPSFDPMQNGRFSS